MVRWGDGGQDARVTGGEVGVAEEVCGGEAGDDGVVGVGEGDEAVEGHFGVVLGDEGEFLPEECGAHCAVVLVLVGAEECVGLVFGELEVVEHVVEFGGGGAEGIVEGGAERGAGGRGLEFGGGVGRGGGAGGCGQDARVTGVGGHWPGVGGDCVGGGEHGRVPPNF
jgi:hypothetical protein